ncbi:hypothetical protein D805_1504 [Bifidobacterium thermophilum RBL67]|uniref:Uncharacterized protein n=1 Tax=Bifidobacterium thermophilum RBL67 TaxID=1254439 RepID=M4RE11_9BIFI|nr:hypothetical protein D805_1504 [Bifidobacterium thermophilum RBL67]
MPCNRHTPDLAHSQRGRGTLPGFARFCQISYAGTYAACRTAAKSGRMPSGSTTCVCHGIRSWIVQLRGTADADHPACRVCRGIRNQPYATSRPRPN